MNNLKKTSNRISIINQKNIINIQNESDLKYVTTKINEIQSSSNDMNNKAIPNPTKCINSLHFFFERTKEDSPSPYINNDGNKCFESLVTSNSSDSKNEIILNIESPPKNKSFKINDTNSQCKSNIDTIITINQLELETPHQESFIEK